MSRPDPRLEGWNSAFIAHRTHASISSFRQWCKESFSDQFRIVKQITPSLIIEGKNTCHGIMVWIKDDDDYFLFKLRWL